MPNHDVRAVANKFFVLAQKEGRYLPNIVLQKLPYVAYGWGLAFHNGQRLIKEDPRARQYGPVYPKLYAALARYGADGVLEPIRENDADPWADEPGLVVEEKFTPEEETLLKNVWDAYKDCSALSLSSSLTQNNTPWALVFDEGKGKGDVIPQALIQNYYTNLAKVVAQDQGLGLTLAPG